MVQVATIHPSVGQSRPDAVSAPSNAQHEKSTNQGGRIHGFIRVGTIPLSGVIVAATNTHSGKKFTSITDGSGAYSIRVSQSGTYQVRAEFPDLTSSAQDIVLDSNNSQHQLDFSFANGPFSPSTVTSLSSLWPAALMPPISINTSSLQPATVNTGGNSGAQFPAFLGDPQYSGDTFTINGQASIVVPYFQMADQMRQDFEDGHQLQGPPMQPLRSNSNSTASSAAAGAPPSSPKPQTNQLHGEIFWNGGTSDLNAQPFVLAGQPPPSLSYSSDSYGATMGSQPFLPWITRPSPREYVLLSYSGQQSTSLVNQFGIVPTELERRGDFSQLFGPTGELIPIYAPKTTVPYPDNTINTPLSPQALALLAYLPEPNLTGPGSLNYRLLTTQGIHSNIFGATYTHSFGPLPPASPSAGTTPAMELGRAESLNINFNFGDLDSDVVNIFPQLNGKQRIRGYSLNAGYTITRGSWISTIVVNSSRNNSQVRNHFTQVEDIASHLGLYADYTNTPINSNPRNFGLPNLIFNGYTGFNETQPNYQLTQTLNVSGSSSWIHRTHLFRFGADIHWIDFDLFGGSNATGTYIFTGGYSQIEGGSTNNPVSTTGNSFADFLLGLPQETTIEAPDENAYARQRNWEFFVRDDWRVLPNLTVNLGLRYDYFSPFVEKNNQLSTLDYNSNFTDIAPVQPNGIGPVSGARYPRSLVEPDRNNFSPHLGFAWRVSKDTVVRSGYGMNYGVGQYGTFVQNLAYQPPFADVQANGNVPHFFTAFTLQYGFGSMADIGNYAINRNYRLPYIQTWYFETQQTLPFNMFLDVGYTGSKGTHLDVISAPGFINNGLPFPNAYFDFEDSTAFSNYNALVVHVKKPLENELVLEATYVYGHSIDDASSTNAGVPVVAQNWQDILAEEGNSSFDIRHQVTGSFLYQLPSGINKPHLNQSGWRGRTFGNWSLAGYFMFATGLPLTPYVSASVAEVERGTHGSVRPDRVPGTSIFAGGSHLEHWFNTAAFSTKFAPGQQFGNASRYSIPGPGTESVNLSLSKVLQLRHARSLELRATATNAFNVVQYSGVDTQISSAAFGQVDAVQPMRQITFLARFLF
jgi:trimeric autotransporter adhesin